MSSNILVSLISGACQMNEESLYALESISGEYPYCQVVQMLLARNLCVLGRDPGGRAARRASLYAPNQRLFQAYLQAPANGASLPLPAPCPLRPPEDQEERIRKQQAIIDRFLDSDPRIIPARESVASDANAGASLEEHQGLASETLAEILLQQGKPDKAMDVYQRLCLAFPEKSSYFAKKLEEIKKPEH